VTGNCGRAKPRAVECQGAWHVAELHESGSRLAAHFPRRLGSLPARALLHAWAGTGMPRQVFERTVTARQAKVVSRRILVFTGRQRQERLVQQFIHRLNIEHYEKLLQTVTAEAERKRILRLLEEEKRSSIWTARQREREGGHSPLHIACK
jgi:hypothetical protein